MPNAKSVIPQKPKISLTIRSPNSQYQKAGRKRILPPLKVHYQKRIPAESCCIHNRHKTCGVIQTMAEIISVLFVNAPLKPYSRTAKKSIGIAKNRVYGLTNKAMQKKKIN